MSWPRIFTAMVTPFLDDGQLDTAQAAGLAHYLWGQGSGGFVLAGSTGEAFSLSLDERHELFQAVHRALPPEVPVWIGCGTNDTKTTLELVEAADSWGVDGILLVAPYYNKPSQEGLYYHFSMALGRTSRPVMLYNVPSRTACHIEPDTVFRLVRRRDNLLAVKEASGTVHSVLALRRRLPSSVKIYSGDDGLFLPSLTAGAYGVVSVASHVVGPQMVKMLTAYLNGEVDEATRWYVRLWPVFRELFSQSNPVPLKWLLNHLGHFVGPVRSPLLMPNDDSLFMGLMAAFREATEGSQPLSLSHS